MRSQLRNMVWVGVGAALGVMLFRPAGDDFRESLVAQASAQQTGDEKTIGETPIGRRSLAP